MTAGVSALAAGVEQGEELQSYLKAIGDAAAVAKVPSLGIGDLPEKVEHIPLDRADFGGIDGYLLEQYTNGIVYVDFAFDAQDLAENDLAALPLFCRAACSAGLPGVQRLLPHRGTDHRAGPPQRSHCD